MLTLQAPAKINLTLEVIAKRGDGYHEIRSVIQTINLCDTLKFESGPKVEYHSSLPEWQGEKSLVSKAVRLLRDVTRCTDGVRITVEKRIPLMSGLGGDSSDAAATLRALKQLWRLDIPDFVLFNLATMLGSDVPFFLRGGTAFAQGRGEILTALPDVTGRSIVLVIPSVPKEVDKTRRMYQSLKTEHFTDGTITHGLVDKLQDGKRMARGDIFNTFENVAFAAGTELGAYRQHLLKLGMTNVHLSGSGPALFSWESKGRAQDLLKRLQQQKMECYLVETTAPVSQ